MQQRGQACFACRSTAIVKVGRTAILTDMLLQHSLIDSVIKGIA